MQNIHTYHIHLTGIVQGVGMRPFVVQLALHFKLNGWINNTTDGVHIEFNGTEYQANQFLDRIISAPPPFALVRKYSLFKTDNKLFDSFEIIESDVNSIPDLLLTPDFGLCSECRTELHNVSNRRFHYPFITCTNCGPRFSITKKLPYDRLNTSMNNFSICDTCSHEYSTVSDRRFYSQTNSCHKCSISMKLFENGKETETLNPEMILEIIQQFLKEGKIVSVKGVGGYVLLCDATNSSSIQLLRKRKQRQAKPFALLFHSVEQMKTFVEWSESEKKCLQSSVAPILLLKSKKNSELAIDDIAPGLSHLGCMLPNSPLLELIAESFNKPLICTSANISESPILFRDIDALTHLHHIADIILSHNREIVAAQDDSVIKFARYSNQKIIIRRARGLAPNFLGYIQNQDKSILATGALMKSSFTFQTRQKTFVSQYLGSTGTIEAQEMYRNSLKNLTDLLQFKPEKIVSDNHPDYFSTQLAKEISTIHAIPFNQVQHHKAHFAAVLAEHSLLDSHESILGVIWDGTGIGDDAQIWGSEFFKFENNSMLRCYHFDYFPQVLYDKMSREPRLSAMAICDDVLGSDTLLKEKFTDVEWSYYKKLLGTGTKINCCSLGRVFDAVASLLGLSDKQSYEGEAAMLLQDLAEKYTDEYGYDIGESYFMEGAHYYRISTSSLFSSIIRDIHKNKTNSFIAAKFHFSLVHLVEIIAGNIGVKKVAFSGGVFQNSLLVDMLQQLLQKKLELFFHDQLPPNDENISFGQMVYVDRQIDSSLIMDLNDVRNHVTIEQPENQLLITEKDKF
ncbi:MAG: Carbamoyltransferase HypF [Bacteroidota bacterium]